MVTRTAERRPNSMLVPALAPARQPRLRSGDNACQQQPTRLDRSFIEIRQWLTAEGDYSDLIIEQGLLQDGDLQTMTMVMPFHYSVDQALDSLDGNGRKGE